MSKHFFSDEDLIRILSFLARFMREADVRGISEAHAFIALSSFLTGFAQSLLEAVVEMTNSKEGKMCYWLEVVLCLLSSYAQSAYIISAISDLRCIPQSPGQQRHEYWKRLNDSITIRGSMHGLEEILTMFIE